MNLSGVPFFWMFFVSPCCIGYLFSDAIVFFSLHGKISVDFTVKYQGPVVQSIVSLTSSLRGQLVKCYAFVLILKKLHVVICDTCCKKSK